MLLLLAACGSDPATPGPTCGAVRCATDEICANTMQCWPADDVQAVTVHWTVDGAPADATSCASSGDATVSINSPTLEQLTWSPVRCDAGQFAWTALPDEYDMVNVTLTGTLAYEIGDIPPGGGDVFLDLTVH